MASPTLIGSKYYLRVAVPSDLAKKVNGRQVSLPIAGKPKSVTIRSHVKVSLQTSDMKEAKARFSIAQATLEDFWVANRKGPVTFSHKQSVALAGEIRKVWVDAFDENPASPEIWKGVQRVNQTFQSKEFVSLMIPRKGKSPLATSLEIRFGKIVDAVLMSKNIDLDPSSRPLLLKSVAKAMDDMAKVNEAKADGNYGFAGKEDYYPAFEQASHSPAAEETIRVTINSLFERWEREHLAQGKAKGTVRDFRGKVEIFKNFIAHEDAEKVTRSDVGRWVDSLLHEGELSPATVRKKYLASVSSIFRLGVSRGELSNNPTNGIRVSIPKAPKTREKGYTDAEAKRLLLAALGSPDSLGRMAVWNKDAIRWVPWLCAYTGARVTEIAQLHKEDFEVLQGVLCIRITPEDGRSVKTGTYRRIPLHSHLLEIGIAKFVNEASNGPLFFKDPANKAQRLDRARSAGEKVRKWVRNTVSLDDQRIQPNHAWRHRFNTLCTRAGIEARYSKAIQGHEDGSAASSYGDLEVATLKREIEKIPRQT